MSKPMSVDGNTQAYFAEQTHLRSSFDHSIEKTPGRQADVIKHKALNSSIKSAPCQGTVIPIIQ
jgi:hypothetical protein